ncbi:MAG: hypothetical protein EKK42_20445 [Pseudonocardiaceae bacterium]|nr:MAG: hypothetical protein EKK42_20445 [Pseudonocardiaceae bacterium]
MTAFPWGSNSEAPDWSPEYASLDHIVPQSCGGTHDENNLRTAHHICNSLRNATPLDEFTHPLRLIAA